MPLSSFLFEICNLLFEIPKGMPVAFSMLSPYFTRNQLRLRAGSFDPVTSLIPHHAREGIESFVVCYERELEGQGFSFQTILPERRRPLRGRIAPPLIRDSRHASPQKVFLSTRSERSGNWRAFLCVMSAYAIPGIPKRRWCLSYLLNCATIAASARPVDAFTFS